MYLFIDWFTFKLIQKVFSFKYYSSKTYICICESTRWVGNMGDISMSNASFNNIFFSILIPYVVPAPREWGHHPDFEPEGGSSEVLPLAMAAMAKWIPVISTLGFEYVWKGCLKANLQETPNDLMRCRFSLESSRWPSWLRVEPQLPSPWSNGETIRPR